MVRFPVGARTFPLLQNFRISAGIHPASYSMDIGGFHPGDEGTVRGVGQ